MTIEEMYYLIIHFENELDDEDEAKERIEKYIEANK